MYEVEFHAACTLLQCAQKWMDGRANRQTGGQTDQWMDRWMDGRTDRHIHVDGWTNRWTNRWTDVWMDGLINECLIYVPECLNVYIHITILFYISQNY